MKRSEINAIMQDADDFIRSRGFYLPPFAYWTPDEWRRKGPEVGEIVVHHLGWDITDFGKGDFRRFGLFLFTIRNGSPANLKSGTCKPYAEKLMIVDDGQITPMHFHWAKMEDIINRGGGNLVLELCASTPAEGFSDKPVEVSVDGMLRSVKPGGKVVLTPGESICLTPGLYHRFYGERRKGTVLVGEVSMVNDDKSDNRFYEPQGRFPEIEEDEEPVRLLVTDYGKYL